MNDVAKQPSVFHPNYVVASTPLKYSNNGRHNGTNDNGQHSNYNVGQSLIGSPESPLKGHRIQWSGLPGQRIQGSGLPSLEGVSSIASESMQNPLARLGEMMRRGDAPSRRVVHSPPNTERSRSHDRATSGRQPDLNRSRSQDRAALTKAPTLTSAMTGLSFLNKSPILREKFMRIQRERDTSPLKEAEWLVQSPEKDARQSSPVRYRGERQSSPVRYRNEIDTSDLSEVSPTKRRRTDSPERKSRDRTVKVRMSQFRPITPPNQWAKVTFASPEREVRKPSPRKISPRRPLKPTVLPSAPVKLDSVRTESASRQSKHQRQQDAAKKSSETASQKPDLTDGKDDITKRDNRRPKLMDRSGELHSMKSDGVAVPVPGRSLTVPEVMRKAMQNPDDFLKSLARSARFRAEEGATGGAEVPTENESRPSTSSQPSTSQPQRSASQQRKPGAFKTVGAAGHGGARPKTRPSSVPRGSTGPSSVSGPTSQTSETTGPSSGLSAPTSVPTGLNSIPSRPTGPTTSGPKAATGPSMEKWKRPTHMKPQAATTRNLTEDMATVQADLRKTDLMEDYFQHLQALDQSCLTHDETLDDISSIASLRSLEADPILRPAPSDVRIGDTSSTAWTKTGSNDELDTSSTRKLVEQLQEPKVRKTYRNTSPTKRVTAPFTPIDPATASGLDKSLVMPKLITQVVVDERKSPRKDASPSKKVAPKTNRSPQKKTVSQSRTATAPTKKKTPPKPEPPRKASQKKEKPGLEARGIALAPRKPDESTSPQKPVKKEKKRYDTELLTSLKSSLQSEIEYLKRTRRGVNTDELVRALSLADSLQRRGQRSTSSEDETPRSRRAGEEDEQPRLRRAGTYEVVNESQWGELDTVPTTEKEPADSASSEVELVRSSVDVRAAARGTDLARGSEQQARGSESAPDTRLRQTVPEAGSEAGSSRSEVASSRSETQRTDARTARTTQPRNARSSNSESWGTRTTDPRITGARTERREAWSARDSGSRQSEARSGRTTEPKPKPRALEQRTLESRDSRGPRAAQSVPNLTQIDLIRSARLRALDPYHTTPPDNATPRSTSDVTPRTRDVIVQLRNELDAKLEVKTDANFEAQKVDLKASLKGVKAKLETLRSDLQMAPILDNTLEAASSSSSAGRLETEAESVASSRALDGVERVDRKRETEYLRREVSDRAPRHEFRREITPRDVSTRTTDSGTTPRDVSTRTTDSGITQREMSIRTDSGPEDRRDISDMSVSSRGLSELSRRDSGRDNRRDVQDSSRDNSARDSSSDRPSDRPRDDPRLSASRRLGEIEAQLRRRQSEKERELILTVHEDHLVRTAASCQRELDMIRRVRRGELTYQSYGADMLDLLTERLEQLHLLKSKILAIPHVERE